MRCCQNFKKVARLQTSVENPWHFGTDADQGIRATDLRIRIRILLFSSMDFKIPTKKLFYKVKFFSLLLVEGTRTLHQSSKKKNHKEDTKQLKTIVFVTFFCLLMDGSGSVQIMTDPDPLHCFEQTWAE
jgi:hypothetical protein